MPIGRIPSYVARRELVKPGWHHVDATGKVLGRMAVEIARVLMGKHRPTYTPHVDTGDFVVVTNAAKVRVTGRKTETMRYARYSYYPGGYKEVPYSRMIATQPERVITEAVRRMLPKSSLGRKMLKKLKVYRGEAHPHAAQQPKPWMIAQAGDARSD